LSLFIIIIVIIIIIIIVIIVIVAPESDRILYWESKGSDFGDSNHDDVGDVYSPTVVAVVVALDVENSEIREIKREDKSGKVSERVFMT